MVFAVTKKQFKRWMWFSMRMAKRAIPCTERRRERILTEIKSYFRSRIQHRDWPEMEDWDGNAGNCCVCDQINEFFDGYLHWNKKKQEIGGKFFNQITCCLRAGFDLAVSPSAGVIGFTAEDLRRMWKGKVPGWVKKEFENFDGLPDEELLLL
jgi:hypothetical protein